MRPRHNVNLLLTTMMVMVMVLLDSTNYVWMLPPPRGLIMESVDMKHELRWRPLQAPCNTTVLYSVQFQGEFELLVLNGSWVDAAECQQTPHTRCDLTFDLGSDSDYNLQVRARCGSELSAWTRLSLPFNRRDSVLTAPQMAVTAAGNSLQVSFNKLPVDAAVRVMVWKRGDEQQVAVHTLPAEQTMLLVAALQEGAEYCVRAQTLLNTQLYSSSTATQCVFITGPDAAWKRPTAVTVTVVVMAALLFAAFWSVVHCRADVCRTYFHKETLPDSLKPNWDVKIPLGPEEAELCERIHVVPSDDSSH